MKATVVGFCDLGLIQLSVYFTSGGHDGRTLMYEFSCRLEGMEHLQTGDEIELDRIKPLIEDAEKAWRAEL